MDNLLPPVRFDIVDDIDKLRNIFDAMKDGIPADMAFESYGISRNVYRNRMRRGQRDADEGVPSRDRDFFTQVRFVQLQAAKEHLSAIRNDKSGKTHKAHMWWLATVLPDFAPADTRKALGLHPVDTHSSDSLDAALSDDQIISSIVVHLSNDQILYKLIEQDASGDFKHAIERILRVVGEGQSTSRKALPQSAQEFLPYSGGETEGTIELDEES